jgi:hypothetical protein
MSVPAEENPVVKVFAHIGLCATQYATLEFHTQFLSSYLHTGKEMSLETVIFTRQASFAEKLKLIKEFAAYRLNQHPEVCKKVLDLVSDIDKQRDRRNLFIHGYWLVNEFVIMEGLVRVSDTKWKYNKDRVEYRAMESTDISLADLEKLPAEIGKLIQRMHELINELKKYAWPEAKDKKEQSSPNG